MDKKLKDFLKIVGLSALIVPFLAVLDDIGFWMWRNVCNGVSWCETYHNAERIYMAQFWIFSYALIFVVSLMYYFKRKDWSETLAIFLTPVILLQSGWEDIFFYLIRGLPLWNAKLGWLWNNAFTRFISILMGLETVTGKSLILSSIIGLVLVVIINYFLYKWKP